MSFSLNRTCVIMEGKRRIMLGSNNYLGLTVHPEVKQAAIEAIQKYGTGCSGSRFLNGTLNLHTELERRLAKFLRKEAVITFSTGLPVQPGHYQRHLRSHDYIIPIKRTMPASMMAASSAMPSTRANHSDMNDLERSWPPSPSMQASSLSPTVYSA